MTDGTKPPGGSPLRRWSRLKHEAARAKAQPSASPLSEAPVPAATATSIIREEPDAAQVIGESRPAVEPLPAVESLTIESDFSGFLQPTVDDALKRRALKQLFRDPHFNVMDGLDVYVGDYSQPDPISPDIVREMVQGRYIFDPPPTRINAQGYVEDVPAEELAALERERQLAALDAPGEPRAEGAAALTLPPPEENAPTPAVPAREPAVETPSTQAPDAPDPPAR